MISLKQLVIGMLPSKVYRNGLENFPIATVDFVLQRKNGDILLIQRSEGAYKDQWFVTGGRVGRGETLREALARTAKREIGLNLSQSMQVRASHWQDVYNPAGENTEGPLPAWHSIWHFYVITISDSFEPQIDSTSKRYKWFNINEIKALNLAEPVKEALSSASLI